LGRPEWIMDDGTKLVQHAPDPSFLSPHKRGIHRCFLRRLLRQFLKDVEQDVVRVEAYVGVPCLILFNKQIRQGLDSRCHVILGEIGLT
jgi:hypothetical protein